MVYYTLLQSNSTQFSSNTTILVPKSHVILRRRLNSSQFPVNFSRIRVNFSPIKLKSALHYPYLNSKKFKVKVLSFEHELDAEKASAEPGLQLNTSFQIETMKLNYALNSSSEEKVNPIQSTPFKNANTHTNPNSKSSPNSNSESQTVGSSSMSSEEDSEKNTWTWKDFRGKKHKTFFTNVQEDSENDSVNVSKSNSNIYRSRIKSIPGNPAVTDILNAILECKLNADDVRSTLDAWNESSLHFLNLLRELKRIDNCHLAKIVFDWARSKHWYKPKIVTYGTIISIVAREGDVLLVERYFEDIQADGLIPCGFIYAGCMDALTRFNLFEQASDFLFRRQEAGDADSLSYFKILLDSAMENAPLSFVSSLLSKAEDRSIKMDAEAFEIIMRGFSIKNLPSLIIDTFNLMKSSGVSPSATCHSLRLSALAKLGQTKAMESALESMEVVNNISKKKIEIMKIEAAIRSGELDRALELFRVLEKRQKKSSPYLFSLVLSACGRTQRVEEAFEVLEEMRRINTKRSLVLYNMVLSTCGRAKQFHRMDDVMDLIETDGLVPDTCTYATLIQHCRGAPGGTQRAIRLYAEMKERGILPDTVAYLTYIDLLCKEGYMQDAQDAFDEMKERQMARTEKRFFAILAFGWARAGGFDETLKVLQEGRIVEERTIWRMIELGIKNNKIHELKDIIADVSKKDETFLPRIRPYVEKWKLGYKSYVSLSPETTETDLFRIEQQNELPTLPSATDSASVEAKVDSKEESTSTLDQSQSQVKVDEFTKEEWRKLEEMKKEMKEREERERKETNRVLKLQSRPSVSISDHFQSLRNADVRKTPVNKHPSSSKLPADSLASENEIRLYNMGWEKMSPSNHRRVNRIASDSTDVSGSMDGSDGMNGSHRMRVSESTIGSEKDKNDLAHDFVESDGSNVFQVNEKFTEKDKNDLVHDLNEIVMHASLSIEKDEKPSALEDKNEPIIAEDRLGKETNDEDENDGEDEDDGDGLRREFAAKELESSSFISISPSSSSFTSSSSSSSTSTPSPSFFPSSSSSSFTSTSFFSSSSSSSSSFSQSTSMIEFEDSNSDDYEENEYSSHFSSPSPDSSPSFSTSLTTPLSSSSTISSSSTFVSIPPSSHSSLLSSSSSSPSSPTPPSLSSSSSSSSSPSPSSSSSSSPSSSSSSLSLSSSLPHSHSFHSISSHPTSSFSSDYIETKERNYEENETKIENEENKIENEENKIEESVVVENINEEYSNDFNYENASISNSISLSPSFIQSSNVKQMKIEVVVGEEEEEDEGEREENNNDDGDDRNDGLQSPSRSHTQSSNVKQIKEEKEEKENEVKKENEGDDDDDDDDGDVRDYELNSSSSPSTSSSLLPSSHVNVEILSNHNTLSLSEFKKSPTKEILRGLLLHHCGENKFFSSPASILTVLSQQNLSHSLHMQCMEWMAQICCDDFDDRDKLIFSSSLLRLLHSDAYDLSFDSCRSVVLSMMRNGLADMAKSLLQEMGRHRWPHARHVYHAYMDFNLKINDFDSAKSALLLMREDGFQLSACEFCPLLTWLSEKGQKESKDMLLLLEEVEVEGILLHRECMLSVFSSLVRNKQYVKSVTWLRKFLGSFPDHLPDESTLLQLLLGLQSVRMWRLSLDIFTMLHPSRKTHTLEGYGIVMKTLIRCNQPQLAVEISAQMNGLDLKPDREILYLLRNAYRRIGMEEEWTRMNELKKTPKWRPTRLFFFHLRKNSQGLDQTSA